MIFKKAEAGLHKPPKGYRHLIPNLPTRAPFRTLIGRMYSSCATIDRNRSGLLARMFFAWKLALSVENN